MVSTCLVSLSLWSKHRAMSVKSSLTYLDLPDHQTKGVQHNMMFKSQVRDGTKFNTLGGGARLLLLFTNATIPAARFTLHLSQSTASIVAIPSGDASASSSSTSKPTARISSSNNLLAHNASSSVVSPLTPPTATTPSKSTKILPSDPTYRWYHSLTKVTFLIALTNTLLVLLFGMTCSIFPGWIWHFSAMFFYNVPKMRDVDRAIDGVCPSYGGDMCLSNDAWLLLSNGLLSKYKRIGEWRAGGGKGRLPTREEIYLQTRTAQLCTRGEGQEASHLFAPLTLRINLKRTPLENRLTTKFSPPIHIPPPPPAPQTSRTSQRA